MRDRAPLIVLVGAVAVLGIALALFGSGSETTAESTTSTFADIAIPDPPLPATTIARAREVEPDPIIHSSRDPLAIPGLAGRLVVVVGQSPRGHSLIVIDIDDGDRIEAPLPQVASDFAIDASGGSISFVAGTERETQVMSIAVPDDPVTLPNTSGFAWSGDEPQTAAWLEEGAVVLGTFDDGGLTGTSVLGTAHGAGGRVVGLTAAGWWATFVEPETPRSGFVEFSPRDETVPAWRFPGDIVVPPRTGSRALVARLDIATWRWTFAVAGGDVDPLPWAPGDAAGDSRFAAFSPAGARIAFIGIHEAGTSWVEIQSTEGAPVDRITLPVRVWEVGWSPDGLFVVMPGSDNAGTHTVLLLDTATLDVHTIEFDDWIQFAAIVAPRDATGGG